MIKPPIEAHVQVVVESRCFCCYSIPSSPKKKVVDQPLPSTIGEIFDKNAYKGTPEPEYFDCKGSIKKL